MISIETTVAAIRARWVRAVSGELMDKAKLKVLRQIGLKLQGTIMRRINHREQAWEYGHLNRQTGNLQRSLFYKVVLSKSDSYVVAGVDLHKAVYGRIQELGGVARSGVGKKGPWSVRIRPAGYIVSSLKDEMEYIDSQLVGAVAEIATEITGASH